MLVRMRIERNSHTVDGKINCDATLENNMDFCTKFNRTIK